MKVPYSREKTISPKKNCINDQIARPTSKVCIDETVCFKVWQTGLFLSTVTTATTVTIVTNVTTATTVTNVASVYVSMCLFYYSLIQM